MHYSTKNKNHSGHNGGEKTNPGDFFKTLEKEFENIFGFDWAGLQRPPANVKEYDDRFEVDMAVPGMEKGDFSIRLEGADLHINAKRETEEESGVKYLKKEFDFGTFERKFTLSDRIDRERISASYDNGILRIRLYKAQKDERTINVD